MKVIEGFCKFRGNILAELFEELVVARVYYRKQNNDFFIAFDQITVLAPYCRFNNAMLQRSEHRINVYGSGKIKVQVTRKIS